MTTIGKYRHLTRATTPQGHFVIAAVDHRASLRAKLDTAAKATITDEAFTAFKLEVITALAPISSAVLTDPAYGIGAGVAGRLIPGKIGLLSPIEVTDYGAHPSEREIQMIPNWSVAAVKRYGADGVKLLLPYHPAHTTTDARHTAVEAVVRACAEHDIPLYLEPIPFSPDPEKKLTNAELLKISVEMCETFSEMGVDVLKLPFPVDAAQSTNANEWAAACAAVNAACRVPWALLSAGVNFDTFLRQSEAACRAGASGVIVGRAVWGEATGLTGDERIQFLGQTATSRLRQLGTVCANHATPWHKRVPPPDASPDWYETRTD